MGLQQHPRKTDLPSQSHLNPGKAATTPKVEATDMEKAVQKCKDHEEVMDKMMDQIIRSTKTNYRFKVHTNTILVILGTILIVSPIVFTWAKSTNMITGDMNMTYLNYFLGGSGVALVVAAFFTKPQKEMAIAISDLAQMLIICNMHTLRFHEIVERLTKESKADAPIGNHQITSRTSKDLYCITNDTAALLDEYIEKHAREKSPRSTVGDKIKNLTKEKDKPMEGSNQE